MDQKTWPWSKYNKTKTVKALKEETEKGQELEKSLSLLNEKLEAVLNESDAKDNLLLKQEKVAEEALAGWEKAEENAASLKRELDDALQQTVATEERLHNLDHSLKECMQQLRAVQQEREKMIDDVAAKTLREEEKAHILEEKLAEAKKMVAEFVADSDGLNAILEAKEEMIKDLNEEKIREEEKSKVILSKLNSSEKQNASLKYEVYMLEKELQIRNEERDFNLKSVKTAHKQHLVSVKKIAELEEECNKLRVMLRKRLPGPAALVKMKNEVEMLGGDTSEVQKKRSPKKNGATPSSEVVSKPSAKREALIERMHGIEEENKILRKELMKKNSELQSSRLMCAHTASKLSHVESQLEGLSKVNGMDAERANQQLCEIRASNSENGGNDDVVSSAESWASVLTTELEHCKNGKLETSPSKRGVLDISLMDDFVEMEKLAVVTSLKRGENPVSAIDVSGLNNLNDEIVGSQMSNQSSSCHIKDVLRSILKKHRVEEENINAILDEANISLTNIGMSELHCKLQNAHSISFKEVNSISLSSSEPTTQQFDTNLDKAICELIEVVEYIKEKSSPDHVDEKAIPGNGEGTLPQKQSVVHTEFVTRVFRWKSLELKQVLEHYLHFCNGLLRGSIGLQKFIREMTGTLNWVVHHSLVAEDVVSFEPKTHRQNELCLGMTGPYEGSETDRSSVPEQVKLTIELPSLASDSAACCNEPDTRNEQKEGDDLTSSMEYQNKCSNASHQLVIDRVQSMNERTLGLQIELERFKQSKGLIGHCLDSTKTCNAQLSSLIAAAKSDLTESLQHFPSLKDALEDHGNHSEDSKAVYLHSQVQPESASTDAKSNPSVDQKLQQLRTNWEISVASEKLAECQEAILNIEKQLNAFAVSGNTAPHHPTLSDQMLAEDGNKSARLNFSAAKEMTRSDTQLVIHKASSNDKVGLLYGMKLPTNHSTIHQLIASSSPAGHMKSPMKIDARSGAHKRGMADAGSALAIVPRKQRPQVSFWRRLLRRRNKESGRKMMMMRV